MNSLTSPGYSAAPGATTAISGETPATEMPTTSSPGNERLIGQLVDVTITEAMTYTLRGEVLIAQ